MCLCTFGAAVRNSYCFSMYLVRLFVLPSLPPDNHHSSVGSLELMCIFSSSLAVFLIVSQSQQFTF